MLLDQSEDDRAWTEQLGPVYTQTQVASLLGKSKQAVSADDGLLRLTMRNGAVGYPVLQFDGDTLVDGVRAVVRLLAPVVATPWTTASWLTSPQPEVGGTPMSLLRAGRIHAVVAMARRSASRMAR